MKVYYAHVAGPSLWKRLPLDIRLLGILHLFKNHIHI